MNKKKNICICLNDTKAYSETFIQAHVDYLEAKIIYTSMLPYQHVILKENTGSFLVDFKSLLRRIYFHLDNRRRAKRINKYIISNSIGVILAEYGQVGVSVLETCKKSKIPLVVHFHGYDAYKKEVLEKYKNDYIKLFNYASAIVVVSKDMQEQIKKIGADPLKIFYNVYGVNLSKFNNNHNNYSSKQILAVGRFVEKKAPYLTILAFSKVAQIIPEAKLVFVGDGILLDVCQKLVKALNLERKVVFKGALSHDQVNLLMKESSVFVQHSIVPSSGDSEGTPNTILEAQACGLPVVSTRHGGIKDVIIHGETGFLVEEGNVDTMAKYLHELLNDPGLATRMGTEGRKNIQSNYTLESSISKLKQILLSKMK